jgi:CheY-like chemotaxis protein
MGQEKVSAEDRLKLIGDLLKVADRYVLAGEFDKATAQVEQVFKLDPDNIYGKAYLNRIEVFRSKGVKKSGKPSQAKQSPSGSSQPEERQREQSRSENPQPEERQREHFPGESPLPDERRQDAYEDAHSEEETHQSADDSNHPMVKKNTSSEKMSEAEERRIVEEIVSQEAEILDSIDPPEESDRPSGTPARVKDEKTLQMDARERKYRHALEAFWRYGSVSDPDRAKLEKLRAALEIGEERHEELERSVKLSAYVNAVKEAWQDGLITPNGAAALDDLRSRFQISIDEHLMIESRIMYELHNIRAKGTVLIIDDDIELARIIKTILREEGFSPFSAHSPEHGLQILEQTTPDLILLDITFPKPSISGFTTYERIRSRSHLRFVPIVFLSGLDEEHIVQVGKKLGADDYITKPCSEQMLVSTIEGKIKRYKDLRKSLQNAG